MQIFVIAGHPDCYLFNHARYIGNYLSEHLPNFQIKIIEIAVDKWKTWLKNKNLEQGWYHFECPLIYKQLRMQGGKAHFIGGLSEFWEYCSDYYGLISKLKHEDLMELCSDSMQFFSQQENVNLEKNVINSFNICIAGDQDNLMNLLTMEIICMDNIFTGKSQIVINVFNQSYAIDDEIEEAVMNEWPSKINYIVNKVDNLDVGLQGCHLLIVTGNFTREKDEDFYKWLHRNYVSMQNLSHVINKFGNRSLRIIIAMHGPVCFNAAVLIEHVKEVKPCNIVAVTADVGLEILNVTKEVTNATTAINLGAPPVWGFIGVNEIVDLEHIIELYNIYRPNERAINNTYDSTLPLGKAQAVIRYYNYMTHELRDVWFKMNERNKNEVVKSPQNSYSKVRSIISLIYNWFCKEKIGNIISLGIISDGMFSNLIYFPGHFFWCF